MTDSDSTEQGNRRVGNPSDLHLRAQGPASTRRARLDQTVRAWVEHPLVRDAFRALFAAELLDCKVSWPHVAPSFVGTSRAGDVCVELARSAAHSAEQLDLSLTADSAARLIDALLGGRPASSMASAAGRPSDAECGVLAYGAARLLASRSDNAAAARSRALGRASEEWLVRDVRPAEQEVGRVSGGIVWPLALRSSLGTLEASVWLSEAWVAAQPRQHTLSLTLAERVDSETLAQLAVGDVWLSEDSTLTLTSEGLTGPVLLAVAGCDAVLPGRLARGKVRTALAQPPPAVASPTEPIELVISTRDTSLLELARLASGGTLAVDASGRAPAAILHRGDVIATGELISWRGALGIRVVSR